MQSLKINKQNREKLAEKLPQAIVYVVDDDEQVRDSLRLLAHSIQLNTETFSTAQEFLDKYRSDVPSCLVLDVCLPGMNGVELLETMRANGIHVPTIVITAHGEVPLAVRAMKAGAIDFVQKPYSRQEMIDLIYRAIMGDGESHPRSIAHEAAAASLAALSQREREIMNLFFVGENTKRIASQLGISPKTVDYHRWNILKKMNAQNMVELAHFVATHIGAN